MNADHPAIKFESLDKTYISKKQKLKALTNFSWEIGKGEIVGLLGPNGAGKTTLVNILMGFSRPDSGEIYFNGKIKKFGEPRFKYYSSANKADGELNTGYLPESFRPNPNITVQDYIIFLFGLSNIKSKSAKPEVNQLLTKVGMEKYSNKRVSTLSKGMAQRLGLAQAFINDPDILVLDEPTSGLDPVGRSEVIEFLLKQKKNNKTIFFCSHILSEVEQVCDKIGILVKGQLKISGKIKYLFQQTKTHNLNQLFKKMVKNTE